MRKEEHLAAVALVHWWAVESRVRKIPETLFFSIPNAGGFVGGFGKNMRRVMGMKAEGVRPGVSDYFLAVPRGGAHGLFLELKKGGIGVEKGRPTPEQEAFGQAVEDHGYAFAFAYGAINAENIIAAYLDRRP